MSPLPGLVNLLEQLIELREALCTFIHLLQDAVPCDARSRQSCPTLWDPMDCSTPGSSIHGIFQARALSWVAISFSRGSCWPRDWTCVSWIAGGFFSAKPPGEPRDVTKDANEQPDEESRRVRSGRAPGAGTSVLTECRVSPPPRVGVFASLEAHPCPYSWVSLKAFSCRHDRLLISFPVPFPSMEGGRGFGAEISKLLILAWSFCPFRSPPRVTPLVQMMPLFLLSFRNLQGFYKPCVKDLGAEANKPIF